MSDSKGLCKIPGCTREAMPEENIPDLVVDIENCETGAVLGTKQICKECAHKVRALQGLSLAIQEMHAWALLVTKVGIPEPGLVREAMLRSASRVALFRSYQRELGGEKT
jgi:hypothetical protein